MTLAIGGWNEGSEKYSKMASNPTARKQFASSALSFIRRHNFDGLDLDWEYPGKRGGTKADKDNFILLIQVNTHFVNTYSQQAQKLACCKNEKK